MLTFNYGSPYFWDKVVLTKFISGCPMDWDLISGTSWFYKSKTEKVQEAESLPFCPTDAAFFVHISVLFTHPWSKLMPENLFAGISLQSPQSATTPWILALDSVLLPYLQSKVETIFFPSGLLRWAHKAQTARRNFCPFATISISDNTDNTAW